MAEERDDTATTLGQALRAVVLRALEEATARGASSVEAEHLLLAMSAHSGSAAGRALAEVGLDHDGVLAALAEERSTALAVAGVPTVDESRLRASPGTERPRWGTSMREALRRANRRTDRGRRRRLAEPDLLIGVLRAEYGTVPRALAIRGIDRDALIQRLQRL